MKNNSNNTEINFFHYFEKKLISGINIFIADDLQYFDLLRNDFCGSIANLKFYQRPEITVSSKDVFDFCNKIITNTREDIVCITTDNYLIMHYFSLLAEYKSVKMQFFSINKGMSKDVKFECCVFSRTRTEYLKIEQGNTLVDIDTNYCLAAHSTLFDIEGEFFLKSRK